MVLQKNESYYKELIGEDYDDDLITKDMLRKEPGKIAGLITLTNANYNLQRNGGKSSDFI